ncbi:MAG: hypothetical protein AABY22_00585 [Nanoarchaeota archaeon]
MIIEITEEEREFLERMCKRAEIFSMKDLLKLQKNDLDSIRMLIKKLGKNDN